MPGWFAWTVNKIHMNCIHLSFSDWSSPGAFSFTNAVSLIKQIIPLVNWRFCRRFPPKHRTKSPLHCNRRPRLVKPQQTFSFYLRCHFNNCECSTSGKKFGNSCGTNYKLDHVTHSNAFSFRSSAFWFMSNVTVKFYTFHVYTLHEHLTFWSWHTSSWRWRQ
jgi:hypothetical protein